jgi:Peptidase S80 family
MAPLQSTNNISFIVETLAIKNGRALRALRPDSEGYFEIPLAALGVVTRNKTYYDIPSFVDQITGTESYINKTITDGSLYSEYGHPDISLMTQEQAINRLLSVKEDKVCNHIKSIKTGPKLEGGGILLLGRIKPHGPYSKHLQQSLDDPNINTSFSLRSIAKNENKNGVMWRKMSKLITFDYCAVSGYQEASKRYSPAVEMLIEPTARPQLSEIALEHFTKHELNDIFGSKEITISSKSYTLVPTKRGASALLSDKGEILSPYHELIGE